MIGRTIDRYSVVEQLGKGGMGVVYKARDTLLDRFVALKVLPPDQLADPDRQRRFLQEAKSASALNHPGIVAVYDVLTIDGQNALVMELVEGETLEELLARKRPMLSEALDLSIEIAEALARAHAAGIVHRDLKPANVMVTADGAKVLDFGLAKLTVAPVSAQEMPTIALDKAALTEERMVLGTIGWMSPEQASGAAVDARSDIFAFGLLMYELLTGKHPFRRSTAMETLVAIRDERPEPLTRIVPELPLEADRAVLRCLNKNPAQRWQSLSDLATVLRDLKEDTESGRKVAIDRIPVRRPISVRLGVAIAAVVLGLLVTAIFVVRRGPAAQRPLELRRLTYDAGVSMAPTISPDGNLVAFSSDRGGDGGMDIWVRHISQPEPTRLTDHPADDGMPSFSPDGSRIVFDSARDGGGIFIVNALGGGLRKVAGSGMFPRFSPDGEEVFLSEDPYWERGRLRRMYRVAVSGGSPQALVPDWGTLPPPSSTGPVTSPDGRLILFVGGPIAEPGEIDWWVAPIDGGEPWSSGAMQNLPRIDIVQFPSIWLPGRLIFLAGTTIEGINLYSAEISAKGEVSGPALPLTAGPGMSWLPKVSDTGQMVLSRFQYVIHLWDVELDLVTGRAIGSPSRITRDASPKFSFSLTRDGGLLAYSTYSGPREDRRVEIRIQDRATGDEHSAVSLPATSTSLHSRLSRDGSLLAYRYRDDGRWMTYVATTEEPLPRELCEACMVIDFFSSGDEVLVDWGRRISRVRIADGEEIPILEMEEGRAVLDSDLSLDDRWLAILTGERDGRRVISVAPFGEAPMGPEDWIEIAGGETWVGAPRWSQDGAILYYLSERDDFLCVWAQSLDPKTKAKVGEPFSVVHAHISSMKLFPMMRSVWTIEVGRDRLVFNASAATGDVYTAYLKQE